MEISEDEEIIENNCDEDEFDSQIPLEQKVSVNVKVDNNNLNKKVENNNSNSNKENNKNLTQIKNSNTSILSSKKSAKNKQIISVSVILPKNTQTQRRYTKLNINKNNNPFRNPESKPKLKTPIEVYQEVKTDIDVKNNNNVLNTKKQILIKSKGIK